MTLFHFIFSTSSELQRSKILLSLRLLMGTLLIVHGATKIFNYPALCETFPDPIGWGTHLSLISAILIEVGCALCVIVGFAFRLAVLPVVVLLTIAFFGVHAGSFSQGELALVYLLMFILLFFFGAGRLSVDHWLLERWHERHGGDTLMRK